jgi:hypothetical protein
VVIEAPLGAVGIKPSSEAMLTIEVALLSS